MKTKKLSILACDEVVNSSGVKFPYVFIADDAFGLQPHMMKPYPGQKLTTAQLISNYRLSWANRVKENAFRIMVSRFTIFRRPMLANIDKVVKVMKACSALYNFLMKTNNVNSNGDCPANYIDTDRPSGEKPGDYRRKILLLHFSHLIMPGQTIIQGMQNKYEKILPTISFLQRVH